MSASLLRWSELTGEQLAAWDALQQQDPTLRSPYFSPHFSEQVARVRDDVRVLVAGTTEAPIFLPLQRGGMGSARPVAGPLSDYQGAIMPIGATFDPLQAFRQVGLTSWEFDHLLAQQTCFDNWHRVPAHSPVVDIPDSLETWLAERKQAGSKIGEQTMRKRRKIEREVGPLRFVTHTLDRDVFDQVCAWKSQQYERTGLVDVLAFPWTRALLWNILQVDTPSFAGTLSALYIEDRLVAGHIGMRSHSVWHWWFPSYDTELSSYAPGTLLLLEMIRSGAEQGLREIDLGKGDAQYKQRFHTSTIPLAEGAVVVPSVATTLRGGLQRAVQLVRALPVPGFIRAQGRWVRRLLRRSALR